MTIGSNIKKQVTMFRKDYRKPREAVIRWMKRNPIWYRELIAQEWGKQTKQHWEKIFWSATRQ